MVTCRSHVLTQVWLNTCIPGPRAGAKKLIGVANECKSMQMNTTSKDRTCQSLDLCVVCSGSAAHVRLLLAVGRPCHLARVVTQSVQPLHASACAQGSMSKTCPTAFMLRYIDGVRMPKSKPATATGEYLKHCVRACTTNRCKSIKVQPVRLTGCAAKISTNRHESFSDTPALRQSPRRLRSCSPGTGWNERLLWHHLHRNNFHVTS